MPELTFIEWEVVLLLLATTVVAGLVRGFTGFGGPAIMMLVLSQFYHPASVFVLVLLVDVVTNVQLFVASFRDVRWRTAGPLAVASIVALPAGVYVLLFVDPMMIKRSIALVVGISAGVMLAGWRYRREAGLLLTAGVGIVGGVIAGATFIALPIVIFLFAGPALAARARANTIAWGLCTSSVLVLIFMWRGELDLSDVWRAGLIAAVYISSAYAGSRLFRLSGEQLVRRIVLCSLLGLSLIGLVT